MPTQFNQISFAYREEQFKRFLTGTPDIVKESVQRYIAKHHKLLVNFFYIEMLDDQQAARFLDHEIVNQRLKRSLSDWLQQLFSIPSDDDIPVILARQLEIGEVHARIGIPIHLATQGARFFKKQILKNVHSASGEGVNAYLAATYINDLIDIAVELMTFSFLQNHDRTTRTEEAYKIGSLGQNIALEKERQRAALLDWGQHIAFNLQKGLILENSFLRHSEFGLWLTHKALAIFSNNPQMDDIVASVDNIDTVLLPKILESTHDKEKLSSLLTDLQNEILHIKYILLSLFDNMLEVENGRDVLTRLLNRRFLAPVLNREINLARNSHNTFCALLLDVDYFKKVNDTYGHDVGDIVLQKTASILTNMLRSGDFIFRYGGEEIIILLVEVDYPTAQATAERIRATIEQMDIVLSNQVIIHISVSIGAAMFDGHPDYEYLIKRADDALYKAKNTGRNRCVFDTESADLNI